MLAPYRRHDARAGWLFALPAIVLLGGFVLYPLVDTLRISFTDYNGLSAPTWAGSANYRRLVEDPIFRTTLTNSFLMTAGASLLLVVCPLPVAYWIDRRIPFRRFFRSVLYIPVVLPIIVSAAAWKWLLAEHGLVNYVLGALHLVDEPVLWLADPRLARWSVVLVVFWRAFGIYLLIYLAGMSALPQEVFEAAVVDGANQRQVFFHIVVPLLRNSVALAAVVAFVGSMRLFEEIFVLTGGGPVNASKNSAFYIWEVAFSYFDFGYASAMAVVLLLLVLVLVLAALRVARRWEVGM